MIKLIKIMHRYRIPIFCYSIIVMGLLSLVTTVIMLISNNLYIQIIGVLSYSAVMLVIAIGGIVFVPPLLIQGIKEYIIPLLSYERSRRKTTTKKNRSNKKIEAVKRDVKEEYDDMD